MEYTLILDPTKKESVVVTAHEKNNLVVAIEKLLTADSSPLLGYYREEILQLPLEKTACFFTSENKIFAYLGKRTYQMKQRLYQLEERLPDFFIKINQGCIVNISHIEKFEASGTGAVKVILKKWL